MDVFTLYVGQGALAAVRSGDEGIIVDAHMPECDDVGPEEIEQSLSDYLRHHSPRGLLITGLDRDHAHPAGVDFILTRFEPDWVMYPKYYKDTDCATEVFKVIKRHEMRRAGSVRPLARHSVRLDRLDSREVYGLGKNFNVELFSPHIEDMDTSNNCSIVAKVTGRDSTGFRYLVTGDTETGRWERISALFGADLAADVMAASHHGALTGAHAGTLLNVQPHTVLISAGCANQFDHPHPRVVEAYRRVAQQVYATNAVAGGTCLFTRAIAGGFETRLVRHAQPQPA